LKAGEWRRLTTPELLSLAQAVAGHR